MEDENQNKEQTNLNQEFSQIEMLDLESVGREIQEGIDDSFRF